MRNATWQPYAALVVGLFATSLSSIFIRLAQQQGAGSLVISMWRCGLAALVLTPFVLSRYRKELAKLEWREILLAVMSGVMLAAHFASWITSLEYTSILTSTTLVNTNPLMVAFLSPFLLRERLSRTTFLAILGAVEGGILISASGGTGAAAKQNAPLLGAGLALIGAAAVAGYFMIGRKLRASIPVMLYIWLTYGVAALTLLVVVLFSGQRITGLTDQAYFWMSLTGLVPQLIGHSLFNYALGFLSAALVSTTVLGEPIFSTILAILFISGTETPSAWQAFGSLMILTALFFASREEARAHRIRMASCAASANK